MGNHEILASANLHNYSWIRNKMVQSVSRTCQEVLLVAGEGLMVEWTAWHWIKLKSLFSSLSLEEDNEHNYSSKKERHFRDKLHLRKHRDRHNLKSVFKW
jgi:hypothetical protein